MRDWEESVKDVKRYYSCGPAAARDMVYLKTKYKEIKEIVNEQVSKKSRAQLQQEVIDETERD